MRILLAILTMFATTFATAPTATAGPLELLLPKFKTFPECHDQSVLKRIVEQFNWAEENTWHRHLFMEGVFDAHLSTSHPEGRRQIPRRYCRAQAALSDGSHRRIFYMIEGGQGFAGTGSNVAWCISSLDPWREYGSGCRVLRH